MILYRSYNCELVATSRTKCAKDCDDRILQRVISWDRICGKEQYQFVMVLVLPGADLELKLLRARSTLILGIGIRKAGLLQSIYSSMNNRHINTLFLPHHSNLLLQQLISSFQLQPTPTPKNELQHYLLHCCCRCRYRLRLRAGHQGNHSGSLQRYWLYSLFLISSCDKVPGAGTSRRRKVRVRRVNGHLVSASSFIVRK